MVVFQDLPSQGLILFKAKPNTGEPAFLPYFNNGKLILFQILKLVNKKRMQGKQINKLALRRS